MAHPHPSTISASSHSHPSSIYSTTCISTSRVTSSQELHISMASSSSSYSLKQLSMAMILICFSISLLPIQARDSMFFSKTQRNETSELPKETPAPWEKEGPMSLPPESRQGYGLYGHGTNEFTSTTTTNNNNNNNGAEKYDNYYGSGHGVSSRFVNNEYENQGYGMSDTRVLENGKYYHDVHAEKFQNGYDPLSDNSASGYVSYNGNGDTGGANYGYGGYRSGSTANYGNAYKEYNNERFGNQHNNERFADQYNNDRFANQYNNERFANQYSTEGQEYQYGAP